MKEQITAMRLAGKTFSEIAAATDTPVGTVKSYCNRKKIGPVVYENCLECSAPLSQVPGRKRRKFCCKKCKDVWWNHNRRWAVHG